jgi:site-specific DNA-methyltransferase (adenine-specific)/adenine-specific DNA-methyltransferase
VDGLGGLLGRRFRLRKRKEIISAPYTAFSDGQLPGVVEPNDELVMFEDRWTGSYIFENEWQSFRTRKNRDLKMVSASHTYEKPGRYIIAVKVIDIFGNDTMTLVPINVS